MSFRINYNSAAMGALRNLDSNSTEFNSSISRLSTGMRINQAADDPAGLIASEQFKAQIGGLGQAISNNQDGINYAKTAEGALSEVNKLLGDARTLAVGSANSATLSTSQVQANQAQLNSIVASITRIAQQTQYGTKKLLDGTAGNTSSVTDATKIATLNIGGSFNGSALTSSSAVTLSSVTAATQATVVATGTFAFITSTVANAGSVTLNGVTFAATTATTTQDLLNSVNGASAQTGVTATWDSTNGLQFTSTKFGAAAKINLSDANGVVESAAGSVTANGTDALATVTIGGTTVNFTGGLNGDDGLTLTDSDGNKFSLTVAGNQTTSTPAGVGQVFTGSSTFQIGANYGQTASLSLGNFAAGQLGGGAVSGLNMSNLDLTSQTGASNAILVIDKAIDQVSKARGDIGNFQSNVLQSNVRSLGVAKQNLSASESALADTDIASEMTNFSKLQILQQAGMSVLAQANQSQQGVLKLLG